MLNAILSIKNLFGETSVGVVILDNRLHRDDSGVVPVRVTEYSYK